MGAIAAVREAEQWTATNLVGGVVLLAALVIGVVWLIRRYLKD